MAPRRRWCRSTPPPRRRNWHRRPDDRSPSAGWSARPSRPSLGGCRSNETTDRNKWSAPSAGSAGAICILGGSSEGGRSPPPSILAMLPDRLTVAPIARIEGTLVLPGSKSLSNRILLLSALAAGLTEVTHVLASEDTDVMFGALRALGVSVSGRPGQGETVRILGKGGPLDAPRPATGAAEATEPVEVFLGNAGTAMRPLAAVLAAGCGR